MDGPYNGSAPPLVRRISEHAAARYARPPGRPVPVPPQPPSTPPVRPPPLRPPPNTPPVSILVRQPPSTPVREARDIVTLDQARCGPRTQNEYVDSPHLPVPVHKSKQPPVNGSLDRRNNFIILNDRPPPTIISQPTSQGLKKDVLSPDDHNESIICSRCGLCKCTQCTQPRELPSRWICDNTIECSATKVVDYCSCLCVIRALFYHKFKDSEQDDDVTSSDDPCSCCERPHCCKRWTCMALTSLCLPCLCWYWPLKLGVKCLTGCYNGCRRRGCSCRKDSPSYGPGKRLLIESSESSST